MFLRFVKLQKQHRHTAVAPWTIVHADDKPAARLGIIHDLLARLDYDGKDPKIAAPDRDVVALYDALDPKKSDLAR